jgi:IPT/TIG domain/PASTA domain
LKVLHRTLLGAAVSIAALCFCATAGAADVTIGPTLSGGEWVSEECGTGGCTAVNYELGGTGPTLTSPVSGAIVRFSVLGGSTPGTYRLRTVLPTESSVSWFFKKEASAVAVVPSSGVQSYAASLPISAGETVALTMSGTASIGFLEGVGRATEWWVAEPPENGHILGISTPGVFSFDAEVQPAPTISSLSAVNGPTSGGTAVTLSGTDLENTTGVTFGGAPATSFAAVSEGQLTAVAPASATAGEAQVSVTTVAGKATSPQAFTYEAPPPPAPRCVVPKLAGSKLRGAKKALSAARCRLGKVTKVKGATAKNGKVSSQSKKPGTKLAAGAKVNLTLRSPR